MSELSSRTKCNAALSLLAGAEAPGKTGSTGPPPTQSKCESGPEGIFYTWQSRWTGTGVALKTHQHLFTVWQTNNLLFALFKHTHTSTRSLSCTNHPHKHKNIIFFLHYPHQQHKITFLLDTDTVKIIALCTIGSDPFLYLETLCVNMFSLCVCICDLCMYVGEVYKCVCV